MRRDKIRKAVEVVVIKMSEEAWRAGKKQRVIEMPKFALDALFMGGEKGPDLGIYVTDSANLVVRKSKTGGFAIK